MYHLCYILQMSRSASTFSLSDSAKSSAMVQRSNSLDHPPVRARVPVCTRTLCSSAQNPPHSHRPNTGNEFNPNLCPSYCSSTQERKSILHAPLSTQPVKPHSSLYTSKESTASTCPTSTIVPAIRNSKDPQQKYSQPVSRQLPSVGFQLRSLVAQPVNVKGRTFSESHSNSQVPLDPRKAVLTSPRRETLL